MKNKENINVLSDNEIIQKCINGEEDYFEAIV